MGNILGGASGSKTKKIKHLERYVEWLGDFDCKIKDESIFGSIPEMEDNSVHPATVFRFMRNWIDILVLIIDQRMLELRSRNPPPAREIRFRNFKFYVDNKSKILSYETRWRSWEQTLMFRPESAYLSDQSSNLEEGKMEKTLGGKDASDTEDRDEPPQQKALQKPPPPASSPGSRRFQVREKQPRPQHEDLIGKLFPQTMEERFEQYAKPPHVFDTYKGYGGGIPKKMDEDDGDLYT